MLTTTINQIIVRQGVIVTAQWQECVSKVFRSVNWICERILFKEATVHPMLIVKVVYKKKLLYMTGLYLEQRYVEYHGYLEVR